MSHEPASPGLFHSARKLLANLAGLAHTRLELLSTELQEELARLGVILLAVIVSLFFAFLGIAFAAVAVMIAVGEFYRLAVAVLFAVSFLIIGALSAWWMRRVAQAKPRVFDASLAELRKDHDLLMPQP
jgi:uncharacterized membrane protein YqjE